MKTNSRHKGPLGIGRSAFSVENRGHWPVLFIYAPGKRGHEQIARVEPYFKQSSIRQGFDTDDEALEQALRYSNPRYEGDDLVLDYRDDSGITVTKVLELDPHALR